MLVHIFWIFVARLSFGQSLAQWLGGPAEIFLGKMAELTRPILEDIERSTEEHLSVLLLPGREAWERDTADGKSGELIFKTLLASPELSKEYMNHLAGEITYRMESWEDVYDFAKQNGGYIESANNSRIRLYENGKVCTTEKVDGDYKEKDCTQAEMRGPFRLNNAIVFICDTIIIPEALKSQFP